MLASPLSAGIHLVCSLIELMPFGGAGSRMFGVAVGVTIRFPERRQIE